MSSSIITPPDSPGRTDSTRQHRILVVGGSYAGVSALVNLLDLIDGKPNRPSPSSNLPDFKGVRSRQGVQVTLIDSRDGFFHTVGAPLAHVSPSHVRSSWRSYRSIRALRHPNLTFVQGELTRLDCKALAATYLTPSGSEPRIEYDYLLLCTGLKRDWPIIPRAKVFEEYVRDAEAQIDKIKAAEATDEPRVVVIGGGAVGIEFAAEIKLCHPEVNVTLVHSRQELLYSEDLPADFKEESLKVLKDEGVDVVLGQRASIAEAGSGEKTVTLSDGEVIRAGHVINATGKTMPSSGFLDESMLDEDGYIKATPTLTFPSSAPNHTRHFAAGDICAWSGVKRAGTAIVMAHVAATNLFRTLLLSESSASTISLSKLSLSKLSLSNVDEPSTPTSARASDDGLESDVEAAPDRAPEAEQIGTEKESDSASRDEAFGEAATFPHVPPMMGLAIGRQAVSWNPYAQETRSGIEVREMLFGEDLGWASTLRCLGIEGQE